MQLYPDLALMLARKRDHNRADALLVVTLRSGAGEQRFSYAASDGRFGYASTHRLASFSLCGTFAWKSTMWA
jgi:hypothetical protein